MYNNYYRFDKVMYSCDLTTIDLTKSCIHATYYKSRHYLTLMTAQVQETEICARSQSATSEFAIPLPSHTQISWYPVYPAILTPRYIAGWSRWYGHSIRCMGNADRRQDIQGDAHHTPDYHREPAWWYHGESGSFSEHTIPQTTSWWTVVDLRHQ